MTAKRQFPCDDATLKDLYCNQNLTLAKIGEMFGFTSGCVFRHVKRLGLKGKTAAERKRQNLSGQTFGLWTVLSDEPRQEASSRHLSWHCLCGGCGNSSWVRGRSLREGRSAGCDTCDKSKRRNVNREMSQGRWSHIVRSAEARNIKVAITPEYAWKLFLIQNRRCALTGVELHFGKWRSMTASLDRKDSAMGYVEGNVQWVHKDINRMKFDLPQDAFLGWCDAVSKHSSQQRERLSNEMLNTDFISQSPCVV